MSNSNKAHEQVDGHYLFSDNLIDHIQNDSHSALYRKFRYKPDPHTSNIMYVFYVQVPIIDFM